MTGDLSHRLQRMKMVHALRSAELVVVEADYLMRMGFEPVQIIGCHIHAWEKHGTLYTKQAAMKEAGE